MKNDYLEKYIETESALGWLEDAVSPVDESGNAMSMPESADETEPMETELEKAENVENAPHAAITAAGVPPMQLPPHDAACVSAPELDAVVSVPGHRSGCLQLGVDGRTL